MSQETFIQELDRLVSNFDRNKAFYSSKDFQESQLRVDFVSPLFEALGWDVSNRAGNPPHLREVVVESRVEEKGHRRRADYTFQVSGQPRLVVETKRPSEDLEDPKHILQLKKYAWNLQVRFAVLTNFLQTKIYAVPAPPVLTQPNEFLLEQVEFLQYLAKPDLLYGLLSKERVLEGALDKYFETIPKHKRDKAYQRSLFRLRGSKMVDDHFLDDLMEFRRDLARDIVQRNSKAGLTEPEVNEAVQRVIDRIVFLRIGEDRGIIYDPTLLDLVEKWGSKGSRVSFYPRLVEHFGGFNRPYNGLLFKRHPLSEDLDLSDEVLAGFIERISVETSPYRFDVIPVEILGSIYERFLGSVVRITPARVKVEEKPEVRKAGGVYYTPKYIVDYIVGQTVGKLLEGRTPEQVAELRVLDPACGSGSFLLGAFTKIMEYLVEWFHDHPKLNGKYRGWFDREEDGTVKLTPYAKRHILLNNLFGVDIDPQACEVTQLSLYLKLLEGESSASLREHQAKGHAEAFLPDLRNNIKCGNSLIGTEFEDEAQTSLLEGKPGKRVNVFDWQVEFPAMMKKGGFDGVIGNPPYIRMEEFKELKDYLKANYQSHAERSDLYVYFIERAHKLLNKHGRYGMIVSNKFLRSNYGRPLRKFLRENAAIERVVDFAGLPVFQGATIRTVVLLTSRDLNKKSGTLYTPPLPVEAFNSVRSSILSVEQAIDKTTYKVSSTAIAQPVWSFSRQEIEDLFRKLQANGSPLVKYCDGKVCMGIKSGLAEAFTIDARTREAILRRNRNAKEIIKSFLNGRDIRRYYIDSPDLFLIYTYHGVKMGDYPAIERHLQPFKDGLVKRATKQRWYELQQPQYKYVPFMEGPKIIFPDIATTPRFALDEMGYYSSNTTYFIPLRDLYLLGLLNSSLGAFYFTKTCAGLEGKKETYLRFFGQYLEGFPVRTINFSKRNEKSQHDRMVKLVERMMELHKELGKAKSDHDKILLQRQISSTDRQINTLVYDLYGFTKEEIKIAEGAQ